MSIPPGGIGGPDKTGQVDGPGTKPPPPDSSGGPKGGGINNLKNMFIKEYGKDKGTKMYNSFIKSLGTTILSAMQHQAQQSQERMKKAQKEGG